VSTAVLVSFRLGGTDGVSVEAAKWAWALGQLGWRVRTLAGTGCADQLLPGLAIDADQPPTSRELADALADADLVVVENLLSLPLNPPAAKLLARVLAGRPALLHHHDLPWQRPRFARLPPPPDDPAWVHVAINALSQRQLARRGLQAALLRNAFDPSAFAAGRRQALRDALGVEPDELLLLQPTRALPRKNVPGGLALGAHLARQPLLHRAGWRAVRYWLAGPPEDGYGPELTRLLADPPLPVTHGLPPGGPWDPADLYAAADAVVLPSFWEGFGNPTIESALARRPLALGPFPAARELAAYGFSWALPDDWTPATHAALAADLAEWLAEPQKWRTDRNEAVARRHFALAELPLRLDPLLRRVLGRSALP
jgi:glycosyltransferase involved in cell wall biosynthesis